MMDEQRRIACAAIERLTEGCEKKLESLKMKVVTNFLDGFFVQHMLRWSPRYCQLFGLSVIMMLTAHCTKTR